MDILRRLDTSRPKPYAAEKQNARLLDYRGPGACK